MNQGTVPTSRDEWLQVNRNRCWLYDCHILSVCALNLATANTLPTSLAAQSHPFPAPTREVMSDRFCALQPNILEVFSQIIPIPMATSQEFSASFPWADEEERGPDSGQGILEYANLRIPEFLECQSFCNIVERGPKCKGI